jgi:tripartite motif-containing protein 9/67
MEDSDFNSSIGDTIGIFLEFRQQLGTLSFFKNGVKCGRKFEGLTGSFYPAVAMFYGEV